MNQVQATVLQEMIGKTMVRVDGAMSRSEMLFTADDGTRFRFFHEQDCCEGVSIEDICGDLQDLVGQPLLLAEQVSGEDPYQYEGDSHTWTFYKFATVNGSVTVRWLGESNGYYSESVTCEVQSNGHSLD